MNEPSVVQYVFQQGRLRETIDAMDDDTFSKWLDYHFTVCERQDLIGASHHTLDILRKP